MPYLHLRSCSASSPPVRDLATTPRASRSPSRTARPDVLHTHTAKAGTTGRVAALLAGRGRPRAVVHTFHGHVLSGYFEPGARACLPLRRAGARSRHGPHRRCQRRGPRRPRPAPRRAAGEDRRDPVRLRPRRARSAPTRTRAAESARELGVADDAFVIGWAGRLTEIKQPARLVRVCARRAREACSCSPATGSSAPEVEALAAELGVADRVRLLGYVDDLGALVRRVRRASS